jgi:hypothetical protein
MIHPRQLHSLGKLYHEEALQVARVRHLEHEAKAHRKPRSEKQVRWLGKLAAAVGLSCRASRTNPRREPRERGGVRDVVEKSNEGLLVEASPSERAEEVLRRIVETREVNGALLLEADPAWSEAIKTVLEGEGVRVERLHRARREDSF